MSAMAIIQNNIYFASFPLVVIPSRKLIQSLLQQDLRLRVRDNSPVNTCAFNKSRFLALNQSTRLISVMVIKTLPE